MPQSNVPPSNVPPVPSAEKYIAAFDDIDKMCFEIAKSHLISSFNIAKSNGYKKFVSKLP